MRIVLLFVLFMPALVMAEVVKISLAIGSNNGLPGDVPLKYAIRDAQRMHQVFAELGGIRKDRNYLLLEPTKQQVLDVFNEIKGRIGELKSHPENEALVYTYYSGHADPQTLHLNGESLALTVVKDFFGSINADLRILVVDACYSGALLRSKGNELGAPLKVELNRFVGTKGSAIITSSSSRELSFESDALQGSLFSNHWVTGLRGAADLNHDRAVSLLEVYNYASVQTQQFMNKAAGGSQNPGFDFDLVGQKDIVLTDIGRGASFIDFRNGDGEQYTIISTDRQEVIANVRPGDGDSLRLIVPRGNYLVQKKSDDYLYVSEVELVWRDRVEIRPDEMKVYPLEILTRKGKLGWNPHPIQLMLETWIFRDLPTASQWTILPRARLSYRYPGYKLDFSFGYGTDELKSSIVRIERRYWSLGAGLNFSLLNNHYHTLDWGTNIGLLLVKEELLRDSERKIREAGYPGLPAHNAVVYQVGLSTASTVVLKYSFLLNIRIGGSLFLFTESGEKKFSFRFPFSIAIGKRL